MTPRKRTSPMENAEASNVPDVPPEKGGEDTGASTFYHAAAMAKVNHSQMVFQTDLAGLNERSKTAENLLAGLEKKLEENKGLLGELCGRVETLTRKTDALDSASRQLERQNERFYEKTVIEPLRNLFFQTYDFVKAAQEETVTGRHLVPPETLKLLEALALMFEESLGQYGIEPFQHKPGDPFDGQVMRALKEESTREKSRHMKVCRSFQSGFRKGDRILRLELVLLYRFKEVMPAEERG